MTGFVDTVRYGVLQERASGGKVKKRETMYDAPSYCLCPARQGSDHQQTANFNRSTPAECGGECVRYGLCLSCTRRLRSHADSGSGVFWISVTMWREVRRDLSPSGSLQRVARSDPVFDMLRCDTRRAESGTEALSGASATLQVA